MNETQDLYLRPRPRPFVEPRVILPPIRILPPLVITEREIDEMALILGEALAKAK